MIDAGEHDAIGRMLNDLATRTPGRIEPLEWLVDTYGRTSDSFRLPDALAQLGDAYAAQGDFERAKEVLEKLVDREPESDSAKRKLNEVLRKMGAGSAPSVPEHAFESLQAEIPQPEAPKIRQDEELPVAATSLASPAASEPAAAASAEEELDDETQKFIAQSLTDVDLFASYGLTQKAIGLLEAILRRAPMHTPTLEKLLDFVLGAGDDRRTAELAAQLEHIHGSRGDSRSSERFGELRRRFQRAAGLTDEEITAAVAAAMPQAVETHPVGLAEESSIAEVAVEPVTAAAQAAEAAAEEPVAKELPIPEATGEVPEIDVAPVPVEESAAPSRTSSKEEEVDLSDEWASLLEGAKEHPGEVSEVAQTKSAPAEEEDLAASFLEQAISAQKAAAKDSQPAAPASGELMEFEVPEEAPATESSFADISDELPIAAESAAGSPSRPTVEPGEAHEELLPEEELTAMPVPEHAEVASEGPEPALDIPPSAIPAKTGAEPEIELDQDFELVLEPEPVVPAHE